jgi:predicted MFS family arabinose efflux permease
VPQPPATDRPVLQTALAGLIAMAAAMGIGRFMYTPVLPGMMASAGLSASDAGLIASSNYVGYLVGAIAAAYGWAENRERAIMLASLTASALLCLAMAVSDGLVSWIIIRFFAGVVSAFIMILVSTIVFSHLAVAGRDDLQAVHFGGVGCGIAGSALLVSSMAALGYSWRADWYGGAILTLVAVALVALLLPSGPVRSGPSRPEPPLVWSRDLVRVTASYGLFGAGYIVTATFLIAIVRAGEGGRDFEAIVWAVAGLAGIPSVHVWRLLVPRFGTMTVYAIGCVVEALGVWSSVSLGGYLGPLLGAFLLGGTFIAVTAIGLQAGRKLALQAPRRALAFMTAAFGTGQILGPLGAGILADWTGSFYWPSLAASAVLILSALIGLGAAQPRPTAQ